MWRISDMWGAAIHNHFIIFICKNETVYHIIYSNKTALFEEITNRGCKMSI